MLLTMTRTAATLRCRCHRGHSAEKDGENTCWGRYEGLGNRDARHGASRQGRTIPGSTVCTPAIEPDTAIRGKISQTTPQGYFSLLRASVQVCVWSNARSYYYLTVYIRAPSGRTYDLSGVQGHSDRVQRSKQVSQFIPSSHEGKYTMACTKEMSSCKKFSANVIYVDDETTAESFSVLSVLFGRRFREIVGNGCPSR